MGLNISLAANFYPNQHKLPTKYDKAPTGVWKGYGTQTGDASGGDSVIGITMPIEALNKRIITLEAIGLRGTISGNTQLTITHVFGSGLFDQTPFPFGIATNAFGYMGAQIVKLPVMLSAGYPIQTIVPGTILTPLLFVGANVLGVVYVFSVYGFWWDTTEPELKR